MKCMKTYLPSPEACALMMTGDCRGHERLLVKCLISITVPIPTPLQTLQFTYKSSNKDRPGPCGYVFPVDKKWLEQDYKGLHTNPNDQGLVSAPLEHLKINMLAICNRAANYRSFSSSDAYTIPSTLLYRT
ncbi:hypothetical protein SASPL_128439 [Salvia splendens]|uniref:Uncharacterized protein n=1 Tax=Salvia splendens TaxID=180675 RepID=A0A8X8ZMS4_SALSN|nr:hypothetical protein SASPL_128439 [Salvia splendens]